MKNEARVKRSTVRTVPCEPVLGGTFDPPNQNGTRTPTSHMSSAYPPLAGFLNCNYKTDKRGQLQITNLLATHFHTLPQPLQPALPHANRISRAGATRESKGPSKVCARYQLSIGPKVTCHQEERSQRSVQ